MNQILEKVMEKISSSKKEDKTLAILIAYGMFIICLLAII